MHQITCIVAILLIVATAVMTYWSYTGIKCVNNDLDDVFGKNPDPSKITKCDDKVLKNTQFYSGWATVTGILSLIFIGVSSWSASNALAARSRYQ